MEDDEEASVGHLRYWGKLGTDVDLTAETTEAMRSGGLWSQGRRSPGRSQRKLHKKEEEK